VVLEIAAAGQKQPRRRRGPYRRDAATDVTRTPPLLSSERRRIRCLLDFGSAPRVGGRYVDRDLT
jgi:hypothetical protein